jgi:hypothetical protein
MDKMPRELAEWIKHLDDVLHCFETSLDSLSIKVDRINAKFDRLKMDKPKPLCNKQGYEKQLFQEEPHDINKLQGPQ